MKKDVNVPSKNKHKNLIIFCWYRILKVTDEKSSRIRKSKVRIRGSLPKCHGSGKRNSQAAVPLFRPQRRLTKPSFVERVRGSGQDSVDDGGNARTRRYRGLPLRSSLPTLHSGYPERTRVLSEIVYHIKHNFSVAASTGT
jgi:hypothetical protein